MTIQLDFNEDFPVSSITVFAYYFIHYRAKTE